MVTVPEVVGFQVSCAGLPAETVKPVDKVNGLGRATEMAVAAKATVETMVGMKRIVTGLLRIL